ncbi:GNAT family N-acetyltransferase [Marinimicrobium koreense]|uniref:GNAT family N-acetyltransferase n=1 Tax=Marinimicrobium koreense TaxID=306545 RepID=UPI000F4B91DF|nr:GNAT family N-acetyltransferase [Marinimicrobium koreense]
MEVRQVELAEIEGLLALIDEYDRPISSRPSQGRIRDIYTAIRRSGGCIVGAFTEEGNLLGTCTLNVCPNLSWSGRPYAIIENVIVAANYRNQGIGKQILSYAKACA